MKILVIGGAGFIGRHLCKELVKDNDVIVLDDLSNSTEKDVPEKVKFIEGDIRKIEDVKKASEGVNLIYHLAAKISVPESEEKKDLYKEVNIEGTKNIFEINKDKKIIFISSASVYGNNQNLPIKESEKLNPLSYYGETKLEGEKIILQNPKNCVARPFNIYGKGQSKEYAGVLSIFINQIKNNKQLIVFGDGGQTRDYIHINDVVSALIKLQNENGIYNIATGKKTSINEIIEIIKQIRDVKIEYKEKRKGDILHSYADVSKLKKTGWMPTIEINECIKQMIK